MLTPTVNSAAEEATCDTLQTTGNVVGTLIFLSAVLCLLAVNSIRLSTLATPPPSPAPKHSPAPPIVATPIRDSYAPPDQDDFPLAEPFLPILSYADATDATNSAAFWPLSLRHLSRARKFLVLSLFSSLTSLAYYSATTPLHDLCGSIAGATDTRSDVGCGYGGSYVANTCAAILAALALFPVTAAIFRLQVLTEHDQHLAPMTNGLARNTSGMCCLITIAFLTIWLAFPGEPGGIFTALDYCDSDDSWAYLSTRPPTCPSGAGYYQSPTYDSTGDSADSTVCYETCCEPGVNPTVDYNQYLKDGSKECDAGLKSLSNAACSPFARAFVDDFNVDQMQQQPVHMCEAFCSVLWGDCLNSTIAGGENEGRLVGDVYAAFDSEFCEKELKLAEVRDGFFVDDCFSGVGGAYAGGAAIMISVWSIAALI